MNWPLWIIALGVIGAPTGALILDRVKGYPATKFFKTQGLAALAVFIVLLVYMFSTSDPILSLVVWGAVGGLLATVALDIVRLLGVRAHAFPLDMPRMFGSMALGSALYLPKHVMADMVAMFSQMPEEGRMAMMEPRIRAVADMGPTDREAFLSLMFNGLMQLPQEARDSVMKTQIDVVSLLTPEKRRGMMESMDQVMRAGSLTNPPPNPMPAFRAGLMPKIPMNMFQRLIKRALPQAAEEKGRTMGQVILAGYLWHFINGATYGIAYTLLFGRGSWLLVFAWCTFIWLVMMIGMPKMMPMVHLPYPRFMVVPLLAHWAMAVPIGLLALAFVTPQASASSLFGSLLNI